MSFISYAQNYEDVMLWRALKDVKNGFYIDVGANHPAIDSVTKAFYERGWRGINVEPEKELYDLLKDERPKDVNLNIAISASEKSIDFFVSDIRGWSTTDRSSLDNLKEKDSFSEARIVPALTLDELCIQYNIEKIHFLKIDVEGAEKDVLKSFSFQKVRPWIVVIEATRPTTQIDISAEWEYILFEHDYLLAYFDGINKFYVAKEYKELLNSFQSPPNVFDEFIISAHHNANLKETEYKSKMTETEARMSIVSLKALEAETKVIDVQKRIVEVESRVDEAWHNFHIIESSNSWKMTKPLRLVKPFLKNILINIDKGFSRLNHFLILKKIDQPLERPINSRNKLFIDCSFIYSTNLNTGIQRVVRNIVNNIEEYAKEENLELVTVALVNGFIIKIDMKRPQNNTQDDKSKLVKIKDKIKLHMASYKEVEVIYKDDILLMLDSTWHLDIWPSVKHAKNRGAKIIGVTYDLIPISHPQFCDDSLVKLFADWYDVSLKYFDGYIAISKTVMLDVQQYLEEKGTDLEKYSFDFFRLGSDFKDNQIIVTKIRNELQELYQNNKSIYLIVSTIEPRKNHQYLFESFKKLWDLNIDATLVIVGRVGWKTENLIEQMVQHSQYQKRLWIFNDLDDNELNFCYKNSKALLFPSFIEGYGLPIIESLQNSLPVLASDTPIHQEVGGENIDYFDINDSKSLVNIITAIENSEIKLKKVNQDNFVILTWKESARELLEKCVK